MLKQIFAVALFLTVVEAYAVYPAYPHYSVVHSERNGANFAYSINSAPYVHTLYAAKQAAAAPVFTHGYAFSHPAAVYPHYPVGVYPFASETANKPTVQADKPAEVTADAVIVESA